MASPSTLHTPGRAGKYATFQLSKHYFAIEAHRIRQVIPGKQLMWVEGPTGVVHGAVQSNGRRYGVVDIRARLGMRPGKASPPGVVILVQVRDRDPTLCVGIVVDKVADVLDFRERDIRGNVVQLHMYGRPYGRPKTLIDIERLFTQDELAKFKEL
jgi:chemotaxis signal transduction protein